MAREVRMIVHPIAEDGLPDMDALVGRVAFLFDGCVVSGGPLTGGEVCQADGSVWVADTDVGHNQPLGGVTHWVEFPAPLWKIERGTDGQQ